ncbi:MAG: addiction module protein [Proteobacteria bacterium]|nr:addiction module protein [Pseudomonadota bacterium]
MNPDALEQEALHLPVQERARLAQRLLESLDELSDSEVEQLWLTEAERRAREIDEGSVELVSGDELDRRIRDRL